MSGGDGVLGGQNPDEQADAWLLQHSQETRDGQLGQVGENPDENRTREREIEENDKTMSTTTSTPTNASKRTLRDFLETSPTRIEGDKRAKMLQEGVRRSSTAYLSIEGLRKMFRKVTAKENIALYCLSIAYIPLMHILHNGQVSCSGCSKKHRFGTKAFKPYYTYGHAVFELHCTACKQVTTAEGMAEAIVELLGRLKPAELKYLGMDTEPVSEDESEEVLIVNEPMAWIGPTDDEESGLEPEGGQGEIATQSSDATATHQHRPSEPMDNAARDTVLIGLQNQLQRMEAQMLSNTERARSHDAILRKTEDEMCHLRAQLGEYKDQATAMRKERDEMRQEVMKLRGERIGRMQSEQHKAQQRRQNDLANVRKDGGTVSGTGLHQGQGGNTAVPSSPVVSKMGTTRWKKRV